MQTTLMFMVVIVMVAAMVVSLVAVLGWLHDRGERREAQAHHDLVRKITESGDAAAALEVLREVSRADALRTRNGARLAGLTTIAAGLGLMFFLYMFVVGPRVFLVGLIPILVGVARLIHTEFLMKQAK